MRTGRRVRTVHKALAALSRRTIRAVPLATGTMRAWYIIRLALKSQPSPVADWRRGQRVRLVVLQHFMPGDWPTPA